MKFAECVIYLTIVTSECGNATFVVFQAGDASNSDAESNTDNQDVEMQEEEQIVVALPAKKGTKRKVAVVVIEQLQDDLQPPPAKQAHVVQVI
jgi:hypothetical protein